MPLSGQKILVVEDEYMIADDLAALLRQAGAEVVGPACSLPKAIRILDSRDRIDAAVLDINLCGVDVFPLVDLLRNKGIPVMFLTGYGADSIPPEYSAITRCEKPMGTSRVVEELRAMVDAAPAVS